MEPFDELPARSMSLGSSEKTLGGKPRRVGGSPAARPISRWARPKRVTLSIMSRTFMPRSRNDSAMAVAT